jgi:hypothetical protein
MRYLYRLSAEPALLVLLLLIGGLFAAVVFMALSSITY